MNVENKLPTEELTEQAGQFLEDLLEKIGLKLKFSSHCEEQEIVFRLYGPDTAALLSNNGRLLYAINHILSQIFYKQSENGCNFVLDCNEYRSTRAMELELLAVKAAEKVQDSKLPFSLQPMPASERRIIHMTLAETAGIRTESQGSGLHRRVVIVPNTE